MSSITTTYLISMLSVLAACGGGSSSTPDATGAATLPSLDAVAPTFIPVGSPATTVQLAGSQFAVGARVLVDGIARDATGGTSTSASISLAVDELALPAIHELRVIDPDGGMSNAQLVGVGIVLTPVITALVPDHATVGSSQQIVTVVGNDFAVGAHVTFGGVARATTPIDDRHLAITLDATDLATVASVPVTVVNPGANTESAMKAFGVVPIASPAGVLERISVTDTGGQLANGATYPGAIDASGRYVIFEAFDSVLANDTNGNTDIFIRDTCRGATACTPTTIAVSTMADGTFYNGGYSHDAAVTPDFRYIAFLGPQGLINGSPRVPWYLRDTCIGATGSCTPTTISGQAFAYNRLSISNDGRYVAFETVANYTAGDPSSNTNADVYVYDTCVGQTGCTPSDVLVSANPSGIAGHAPSGLGGGRPSMSSTGRYVAFESDADDLVTGDTNGTIDIYLRDTCIGASGACSPSTVRVSVDNSGAGGTGASSFPMIDASGRFVAFTSSSSLVTGASGSHVYLRDTCIGATSCTPTTTLVSALPDGSGPSTVSAGSQYGLAMSRDGRYVGFQAYGAVVAADTDGFRDVFVRDTCAGITGCTPTTQWVSVGAGSVVPDGASYADRMALSPTGAFVSFVSDATNFVTGDTNAKQDAFEASTGF